MTGAGQGFGCGIALALAEEGAGYGSYTPAKAAVGGLTRLTARYASFVTGCTITVDGGSSFLG
ncbi:hypothetical protein ACQP25_29860 [Microtetraspora malaysiensis]|uniref:hypothetical protein n=1 Tax=Microtetraspora malaysiensis TaxID=161358 RepID=UPI003D8B4916